MWGDVAGMGADLFESYVGAILSALLLSAGNAGLTFGLVAAGILSAVVGVLAVRFIKARDPHMVMKIGTYLASALVLIAAYFLCRNTGMGCFWSILSGVVCGIVIGYVTEIYTSDHYRSVKGIAAQSETGPATTILSGYAVGLKSTAVPVLLIAFAGGF